MFDCRFWGPRGAYGAPLACDRHDWYYHCSDIPCHARVPWEGCPYPPDVCHDPKYHYPPPLPVMGPVPPGRPEKSGCGCECNTIDGKTVTAPDGTKYKITVSNDGQLATVKVEE